MIPFIFCELKFFSTYNEEKAYILCHPSLSTKILRKIHRNAAAVGGGQGEGQHFYPSLFPLNTLPTVSKH
jgi:hypothetical protein